MRMIYFSGIKNIFKPNNVKVAKVEKCLLRFMVGKYILTIIFIDLISNGDVFHYL